MTNRKISLEQITIESPCDVPWESMTGDERVRFCRICKKNVFDLSALPREDAEALVSSATSDLCVQIARRADGTVVTGDCTPARLAFARKAARKALVVAGAMAGAVAVALAGVGWLLGAEPSCPSVERRAGVTGRIAAAIDDKLSAPAEAERPRHYLRGRYPASRLRDRSGRGPSERAF